MLPTDGAQRMDVDRVGPAWVTGKRVRTAPCLRDTAEWPQRQFPPGKRNPPAVPEAQWLRLPDNSDKIARLSVAFMASSNTFSLKEHEKSMVPDRYLHATPADVYVLTPVNAQPRTAVGAQASLDRLCYLQKRLKDMTDTDRFIAFMDAGACERLLLRRRFKTVGLSHECSMDLDIAVI